MSITSSDPKVQKLLDKQQALFDKEKKALLKKATASVKILVNTTCAESAKDFPHAAKVVKALGKTILAGLSDAIV